MTNVIEQKFSGCKDCIFFRSRVCRDCDSGEHFEERVRELDPNKIHIINQTESDDGDE